MELKHFFQYLNRDHVINDKPHAHIIVLYMVFFFNKQLSFYYLYIIFQYLTYYICQVVHEIKNMLLEVTLNFMFCMSIRYRLSHRTDPHRLHRGWNGVWCT